MHQAAKLHTFRADHENQAKTGKGFFKLNNESIAVVNEDLTADNQTLTDQHSEEVVQILEEYGTTELEIARQLQENEADRLALGRQTIETVELPDNPREEAEPKLQEETVVATSAPPVSEPTTEEIPYPAPIHVPDATDPDTPLPTTKTTPPQLGPCPTATREPLAQPDLTTEPTLVPLVEPTLEPEPSEPLHNERDGEKRGNRGRHTRSSSGHHTTH